MDVGAWLTKLGLGQYEPAFRDNEIDAEVLTTLTPEDLKDLGITVVGHRRKLLSAIEALRDEEGTSRGASAPAATADAKPPAEPSEAEATPRLDAERRQLTVLFCDLVGSTALSTRLDPEEMREVIGAYQDTCAGIVTRFGGFVARFMGDGVLAYFGYPRAHEDAAERAVRAGRALTEAVSRQTGPQGEPLAARVGIATGVVVVGDLIGKGASREQPVVGETPNLAARLQALAAPNSVVVADETRRILGLLFEHEDLGEHRLKGFSESTRAWRVVAPKSAETRFEAVHAARLTPLVGREEELEALLRRWRLAKAGEGQVALISGEAGIGKSRIAQALRDRLGNDPHIRIRYQCSPYFTNSALHPIVEQLTRAAGFDPQDAPEDKLARLEAMLAQATDRPADVTPLLAALLSIPGAPTSHTAALSPDELKERTLAALLGQMEGLAARWPLLLLFEDVHWMDPTSRELLDRVVDRTQVLPILVIVTSRPEFRSPWIGQPHVTLFSLSRMSSRDSAAIVAGVTRGKSFPDYVLDQIVKKTDGIPLFVEELSKTVLESDVLREEPDRYVLSGPLPPLAIPSSLQDSLMARLDRMASVKDVAQAGAAIGRDFSHELLTAVLGMHEAELASALDQLAEAELIFRRGTPPEAQYAFKHALVRDAAYESLLKSKRRVLHERIADALEDQCPDTIAAEPELLAHHLTGAGLTERAIAAWQRAGDKATQRSAHAEAIALLNRGVELVRILSDTDQRSSKELTLRLALGPSLMLVRSPASPAVEENYARARQLSDEVGSAAQQITALWGLMHVHENRSQWQAAHGLADEMMELATRQDDPGFLLQSHHAEWSTLFFSGELEAACHHAEQGARIYDRDEHRDHCLFFGGHDPGACSWNIQGMCLSLLGYAERAKTAISAAIGLADDLDHPATRAFTYFSAAFVHQALRDDVATRRYAEAAVAIGDAFDAVMYQRMGTILVAWAKAHQGQADEGAAQLDAMLAPARAKGRRMMMMRYYLGLFAEACLRAGRFDEGLAAIDEASETAAELGEWLWEAELLRIKGELLLARSPEETEAPEACFHQSIEFSRKQHAKTLELRAALALSELWLRHDRKAEARDLLSPVYAWFTEGFDMADLKDARSLLDDLA